MRKIALFLVLTAAGLAPVAFSQAPVLETRMFDAGALTRSASRWLPWPVMLPLERAFISAGDFDVPEKRPDGVHLDLVMELIRSSVNSESWDQEGTLLQEQGSYLVARNTPAVLDEVARALKSVEASMLRPVVVRVYRIDAKAFSGDTGTLSPSELSALLKQAAPQAVGQVAGFAGARLALTSGEVRSFVGDYDVEVAQEAQIADARVMTLRDGLDLVVSALPTSQGRFAVHVGGRDSRILSMQKVSTESMWLGSIERPTVRSSTVAVSGLLESGGGLVMGLANRDGDSLLVVSVSGEAGTLATGSDRFHLIPRGLIGMSSRVLPPLGLAGPRPSGGEERESYDPDSESYLEVDSIMSLLRETVASRRFDDDPTSQMSEFGSALWVSPKDLGAKIEGAFTALTSPVMRQVSLEVRAGLISGADAQRLVGDPSLAASFVSSMTTKGCASAILGDAFRVVLGDESTFIADQDVEIAQKAQVSDPVISRLFDGLGIQGRFQAASDGNLVLQGESQVQAFVGPLGSFVGNANDVGVVETPRVAQWRASLAVPLSKEVWTVAGVAPVAGSDKSLVILLRAHF